MTDASRERLRAAGILGLLSLAAVLGAKLYQSSGSSGAATPLSPESSGDRPARTDSLGVGGPEAGRVPAKMPAPTEPRRDTSVDDESPAAPATISPVQRWRTLAREDPSAFDVAALAAVEDPERALAERTAAARAAWLEEQPVWTETYRAALAVADERGAELSRAVQRWLAEDAARDPRAREFLHDALWGPDQLAVDQVVRGRLAAGLAASTRDADWHTLESRLRGEADDSVLRSALVARARTLSPDEAAQLFERFGMDAPPDLREVDVPR